MPVWPGPSLFSALHAVELELGCLCTRGAAVSRTLQLTGLCRLALGGRILVTRTTITTLASARLPHVVTLSLTGCSLAIEECQAASRGGDAPGSGDGEAFTAALGQCFGASLRNLELGSCCNLGGFSLVQLAVVMPQLRRARLLAVDSLFRLLGEDSGGDPVKLNSGRLGSQAFDKAANFAQMLSVAMADAAAAAAGLCRPATLTYLECCTGSLPQAIATDAAGRGAGAPSWWLLGTTHVFVRRAGEQFVFVEPAVLHGPSAPVCAA